MTLMWLRVVVLLCAAEVSAGASYSLLDPDADHTKMAIEFDKAGKDSQAVQSFTAAVKFVPTFRNRHNLGVAFMRLGHKESRNVRMTGFALYGGCLVRGIHWAGLSLAWLQVEAATKFYSLAHKQFTVALELPGASSGERAATESLLTKMSTYFQSQFGRPFTPDPQAVNEFEVDVRASREDPHASAVQVSADGSTRSSSLPASLRLPKHADGSPLFWRGSQDDIARQDAIVTELHGSSAETTTAHGDTGDRQNRRLPRRRASQSTVAFQRYNPKDAIEVRACSTIFATLSWRSWLHSSQSACCVVTFLALERRRPFLEFRHKTAMVVQNARSLSTKRTAGAFCVMAPACVKCNSTAHHSFTRVHQLLQPRVGACHQ